MKMRLYKDDKYLGWITVQEAHKLRDEWIQKSLKVNYAYSRFIELFSIKGGYNQIGDRY